MGEMKHTPGPWEWDNGLLPPDGPERFADIYTVGGDIIIASFNERIPEGEANAHLIAAAPDLLEAGQELQSARKAQKLAPSAENLSRVRAASDAFDAAISRATQSPATEGGV
jgi:hypothetical protein